MGGGHDPKGVSPMLVDPQPKKKTPSQFYLSWTLSVSGWALSDMKLTLIRLRAQPGMEFFLFFIEFAHAEGPLGGGP